MRRPSEPSRPHSAFSLAPLLLLLLILLSSCSAPSLPGARSASDHIRQLQSSDVPRQRLDAARALREILCSSPGVSEGAPAQPADPKIVAALDAALRDRDPAVRLEAARALAWVGHETGMTVPVLEEAMRDHGILALRRAAGQALLFADRDTETALAALLTRAQAAWPDAPALDVTGAGGRTQAQVARQAADLAGLLTATTATAAAALDALARLGPEAAPAVPAIVTLLKTDPPRLRVRAIETLDRLGTVAYGALAAVIDSASYDPDPAVRAAAVHAVFSLDPDTGSSAYYQYTALSDPDPVVRRAAARALSDFGPIAKENAGIPVSPDLLKAVYWPRTLAMRWIGPAIPRLQSALRADADPAVRAESARTLGRISPDAGKVIPSLLAACADPAPQVRAAAAWSLGELPAATPEAAARLRALLDDKAPAVRAEALLALTRITRDDAPLLPLLEKAAQDPAPEVQHNLIAALGEVGAGNLLASKPLAGALMKLAHHADSDIRGDAIQALGRMDLRTDEAVRELTQALNDPSPEVVSCAAEALGWMGPAAEAAIPALERLASGTGVPARDDGRSTGVLARKVESGTGVPARDSARDSARYSAAIALGWIDHQSTITLDRLLTTLRAPAFWQTPYNVQLTTHHSFRIPHSAFRISSRPSPLDALLALGWRGPAAAPAAPLLAGILRERRNPEPVRLLAGLALGAILSDSPPSSAALDPVVMTVKDQVRRRQLQAATGLVWLGPRAAPALPELAALVRNRNCEPDLRVAAAAALGRMGAVAQASSPASPAAPLSEIQMKSLVDALAFVVSRESDPQVQAAAAAALGELGAPARPAAAPLIAALRAPDAAVREASALALGKITPNDSATAPSTVPALAQALADPDHRVRLAAATALGRYGAAARPAQPALQTLAQKDADLLVRQAAASALKRL